MVTQLVRASQLVFLEAQLCPWFWSQRSEVSFQPWHSPDAYGSELPIMLIADLELAGFENP